MTRRWRTLCCRALLVWDREKGLGVYEDISLIRLSAVVWDHLLPEEGEYCVRAKGEVVRVSFCQDNISDNRQDKIAGDFRRVPV